MSLAGKPGSARSGTGLGKNPSPDNQDMESRGLRVHLDLLMEIRASVITLASLGFHLMCVTMNGRGHPLFFPLSVKSVKT